uniref:Ig-like domain-containing protein n=1 Tax=Oryzias melastigma TaxID=30732 RepID=A0A3B3DQY0_ORYME
QQKDDFLSVYVGGNVTLECSYEVQTSDQIYWYKQSLGKMPEIISSFVPSSTTVTFFGKFKNNPRFKLDLKKQSFYLNISDLHFSDTATYHCIKSDFYSLTFMESFIVNVKNHSFYLKDSVDQPSSENIHPGDSVTLNCTVHTGSCDGEHRVYWFKDSEDSHPGLIYTDGGRKDQCERKKNTQTHSCVYNLHMKNLTESHAGIYYCAVASCGHIMFGNGTKLQFSDTENLNYAAINVKRSNRSRRQKNDLNTVCVYAGVRLQN